MKSYLRLALFAGLLPSCAFAQDMPPDPTALEFDAGAVVQGRHPPYRDAYRELMAFLYRKEARSAVPSPLLHGTTRTFLTQFLVNPDSFYSELKPDPSITNAIWWRPFAERVAAGYNHPERVALEMLQRQMGLTKARPGRELRQVSDTDARRYRTREAAANAIKAGVDADIFLKAWDMNGAYPSVAAGYAVALQVLRDRSTAVPAAEHERQALKPDVLARYLATPGPDWLEEQDLRYLTQVLRAAIHSPPDPDPNRKRRHLPAVYRVARVAAAYQDASGYKRPVTCVNDAKARNMPDGIDATIDNQPLCFVDATDRAVHAWYRRQLRYELSSAYLHRDHHNGFNDLLHWVGAVMIALDFGAFVEVVEAAVADEVIASAAVLDESAASSLFPDTVLTDEEQNLINEGLANSSKNGRALTCRIPR